jgi:hypothetical protein
LWAGFFFFFFYAFLAAGVARRDASLRKHVARGSDREQLAAKLCSFQAAVASLTVDSLFPAALWRARANENSLVDLTAVTARGDLKNALLKQNPLSVQLEGREEEDGCWFRFSFNAGNDDLDTWLLTEFFLDDFDEVEKLKTFLQRVLSEKVVSVSGDLMGSQMLQSAVSVLLERGVLLMC